MDAYESRFERECVAALTEIEAKRVEGLAAGQADDFAEYKHRSGYIAGLRAALTVIGDVRKKLSSNDERGAFNRD